MAFPVLWQYLSIIIVIIIGCEKCYNNNNNYYYYWASKIFIVPLFKKFRKMLDSTLTYTFLFHRKTARDCIKQLLVDQKTWFQMLNLLWRYTIVNNIKAIRHLSDSYISSALNSEISAVDVPGFFGFVFRCQAVKKKMFSQRANSSIIVTENLHNRGNSQNSV